MHEIGMLEQAAKTVSRLAAENGITKVSAITLEVGELSGAIPEIFEEYFPIVMKSWPVLQNAELKLYPVKSEGLCLSCNAMYPLLRYNGKCPKCGSDRYRILGGTDIIIKNIVYDCQEQ